MDNQSSGRRSATTAALAIDGVALESQLMNAADPEQCCTELSRIFGVRPDEIGLLRLEDELLRFLFPRELATAGAIPLSNPTAVARSPGKLYYSTPSPKSPTPAFLRASS